MANDKLYFDTSEANNLDAKESIDTSVATPSNVKDQTMFQDAITKEIKSGTMPINPSEYIKINPQTDNESEDYIYVIPLGYHDGTGKVYSGKLSEYTPGNARPDQVVKNRICWVNGQKIVGELDVEEAEQIGTATAEDIAEGQIAWVNKQKIIGVVPRMPRRDKTLFAGEEYEIPYGIHSGSSKVIAASLESQTIGNALNIDIAFGKTAWVNGVKVEGTFKLSEAIAQELADTDAEQRHVVSGKKFYSANYKRIMAGTMTDHSGERMRLINIGQQYPIPEGYYDGNSYIKTPTLEDATVGTATATNILDGYTAWVNGVKLIGSMPNIAPETITIDPGESYNIPYGFHVGTGKISATPIEIYTRGSAKAEDIRLNETAWVNGEKLIGSMPENPADSIELDFGKVYFIPQGFHTGAGNVWTKSIEEATKGTATPEDIIKDKTAWVNGEKITGNMTLDGTAITDAVLPGYTFFATDPKEKLEGTMPTNEAEEVTLLAGEDYDINIGYHTGEGRVIAKDLASQTPGNANPGSMLKDAKAWVDGVQITGTIPSETMSTLRILAGRSITFDPSYFSNGITIYALYDYMVDLTGTDAYWIDGQLHPNSAGYVSEDSSTLVITAGIIE